jgi:hypothetical protein
VAEGRAEGTVNTKRGPILELPGNPFNEPARHAFVITGLHWSYLGADMFWDHADTSAYLRWFREAGLAPRLHRYIPEGNTGHSLILAAAE